jgi:hypothetical protein
MAEILEKFIQKIPKYDARFKASLFDKIAQYGGGTEARRAMLGKHFSNAYELYIYAFFYGLQSDKKMPFEQGAKLVDFSYPIQNWGSKGGMLARKEFKDIQQHIFISCVAKSDINFISLEKGEIDVDTVVTELIRTLESYTNGGLNIILDIVEEKQNKVADNTFFLGLLVPEFDSE